MIAVGQRLAGSTTENDPARRAVRRDRRVSAVVHTWMPVRDPKPYRTLAIAAWWRAWFAPPYFSCT